MIHLIETPQRADIKVSYEVNDDVLIVTVDNVSETFDFTGLEEGVAEEIIAEGLPVNPIISAEKTGDTINIEVVRFYSAGEKHLYEVIKDGDN